MSSPRSANAESLRSAERALQLRLSPSDLTNLLGAWRVGMALAGADKRLDADQASGRNQGVSR